MPGIAIPGQSGSSELDSRPHLLSRLGRCVREQEVPGMFLRSVISSARLLGPEVEALVRQRISGEGTLVESYRYPVRTMLEMMDVLGQEGVARGASYDETLLQCGWVAGEEYVRSTIGRLRAMIGTAAGLQRAIEGIPSAAAEALNFGKHSYRRLSSSSGELTFQEDLIGPAWNAGMVVGSLRAAFTKQVEQLKFKITFTDEDASSFLLHLDW